MSESRLRKGAPGKTGLAGVAMCVLACGIMAGVVEGGEMAGPMRPLTQQEVAAYVERIRTARQCDFESSSWADDEAALVLEYYQNEVASIAALGPRCVPVLLELLKTSGGPFDVLHVLMQPGDGFFTPSAVDIRPLPWLQQVIVKAYAPEFPLHVRRWAIGTGRRHMEECNALLIVAAQDPDPGIRGTAMACLNLADPDEMTDVVAALAAGLRDEVGRVRDAALRSAAILGSEELLPELLGLLDDDSEVEYPGFLHGLSLAISHRAPNAALIDEFWGFRARRSEVAACIIQRITGLDFGFVSYYESRPHMPQIRERMRRQLTARAEKLLAQRGRAEPNGADGEPGLEGLLDALGQEARYGGGSDAPFYRGALYREAEAIAAFRQAAVPALLRLLDSPELPHQLAAFKVVHCLEYPGTRELFRDIVEPDHRPRPWLEPVLLKAYESRWPDVRREAVRALPRHVGDCYPFVLRAATDADVLVRASAVRRLALARPDEMASALAAMRKGLKDDAAVVRTAAIEAAAILGSEELLPELVALLGDRSPASELRFMDESVWAWEFPPWWFAERARHEKRTFVIRNDELVAQVLLDMTEEVGRMTEHPDAPGVYITDYVARGYCLARDREQMPAFIEWIRERIVTDPDEGRMRLAWALKEEQGEPHVRPVLGPFEIASDVAFSPDMKLLACGGEEGTLSLWRIDGAIGMQALGDEEREGPACVSFSPDSRLLAYGGDDKTIEIWDVKQQRKVHVLKGHQSIVMSLSFSADANLLASGSYGGSIKLWDVQTGREAFTLHGHEKAVNSVTFSSDGRLLCSGSADKTVKLWDVKTGNGIRTLGVDDAWVCMVWFARDGKVVGSASGGGDMNLWDSATGKKLSGVKFDDELVAIDPERGIYAGVVDSKTVKLRDFVTGRDMHSLKGHKRCVWGASMSADGALLASYGADGTVRLWRVRDGSLVLTLATLGSKGDYVVWTREGYFAATPKGEERVRIVIGHHGHPLGDQRDVYFRPDLVAKKLAGEKIDPPE